MGVGDASNSAGGVFLPHKTTHRQCISKEGLLLVKLARDSCCVLKGAYSGEKRLEQWGDLILES